MTDEWSFSFQEYAETLFVLVARTFIFVACYTHISRSIFQDLRQLTKSSNDTEDAESDFEAMQLEDLPAPASQSVAKAPLTWKSVHDFVPSSPEKIAFFIFSNCFSDCCILFLIFLFQEIGILSARGRMISWSISLHFIVASLLLFVPLSSNLLLTYQSPIGKLSRSRSLPPRLLFALIPYVSFLYVFWMIPVPDAVSDTSVLELTLARVVVVGTFAIGLFSGIGAAVNMARFLPIFKDSRSIIPTEQEVNSAEEALARVRKDLSTRKGDQAANASQQGGSSWMSRVLGNTESTALQREIDGLVALEYQMQRNLEELRQIRADNEYSRSLPGRVLHVAGFAFSIYCIFRTASSMLNVIAPFHPSSSESHRSYPDLISHFLTYLFSLLPTVDMTPEHIAAVSRQISLVLVGAIILSSIRFVLGLVIRLLRLTNRSLGASLLLLFLAQLMGTYLISTLVQLRTAFPPSVSMPDDDDLKANVLSLLPPYEMFGSAFDWSYLLSLASTGTFIWFDRKLNSVL